MKQAQVAELTDSTPLLRDPIELRRRWEAEGALFFRGLLDPDLVEALRRKFLGPLREEGLIDPVGDDTVWTGAAPKTRRPCDALGRTVSDELNRQEPLINMLRDLLNDEPVWVPIVAHRSSLPAGLVEEGQDIFSGRHQDGFYNEGIQFAICWIPMMDIDRVNGGLAVALGSHKGDYLHDTRIPNNRIPADAIPENAWHTADFKMGDVLVFSYKTPHAGLPNQTNRIRLSIDIRAIPASAPRPVVGKVVKLDGSKVVIRTPHGPEHEVLVDDDTYIRLMDPLPRVPTHEVERVAHPGANVLAMVTDDGRATVLRSNFYG